MFNQRRLEQDLERIRRANLPAEEQAEERQKERAARLAAESGDFKVTAKDILAMTIAVLSLILPYLAVIGGAAALLLLYFFR